MHKYNSFDDVYAKNSEPTFGLNPSEELRNYIYEVNLFGRALDIGCGDGRDTLFLASIGFQTTALDISEVALQKLMNFAAIKGIAINIDPICCDVRQWDFPVSFFDLVTSATGLDHIQKEELDGVMGKVTKSLKPGGVLFLEVHTVDDPGFGNAPGIVSSLSGWILHYFERNELLQLVLKWGYNVIRYEEVSEEDRDHGESHFHKFANIIAKKK